MGQFISRILSLVIAIGYVVILAIAWGGFDSTVLKICVLLMLPLALIWFSDMGNATGYQAGNWAVDRPTPPILIAIVGWLILIGAPVVLYIIYRYSR
jgi:hypothetical protein